MARKPRREILSGSGFYHVFSRGNRKQDIFRSEIDYKHFLKLMGKYSEKHKVEIHAFCLMPNHFHALIRAEASAMAKFLQQLLAVYTLRTNKIYDEVGHLFQGRYQSKPIENDAYLMEAMRYIHNNPRELSPSLPAEEYPWSSLSGYLKPACRNSFLKTDFLAKYFVDSASLLRFNTNGDRAKLLCPQ